jgi:uncharacterized protein YgfB (UPF0149 family)
MDTSRLNPDPAIRSDDAPAFDDCANALLEAGILLSPAELHGALAGVLAGGFTGDASEALAALEKTVDESLTGAAAEQAQRLHADVAARLSSGEVDFAPLLPDVSFDLEQRVASLAAWTRGFLGGYAQARVSNQSADRPVAADSAEVLRDFAAISQAAVDDAGAHAEEDLEAIAEYLGVAAVKVMADSAAVIEAAGAAGERKAH